MKHTLSVVISAYNEEKTLARCLESVRRIADEIIIVDNESSDRTVEIAKKFTDRIFLKPNQLMLNINKNFGFEKATGTWILNLDADEEIPPELASEVKVITTGKPKYNGYWIKRKNISYGKWIKHGLWWPDRQIRLFKRGFGAFQCVHIHEYVKIDGETGELVEPYIHYNYESVHQYLLKIDRTSSSEAISLSQMNYPLSWFDAIRFPVSDFVKIYFAQEGWKDGLHGLVLSLFQAFYSFCTFAKYWEMKKFEDIDIELSSISHEIQKQKKEVWYWVLTAKIKEAPDFMKNLLFKIQRKFLP